MKTVIIVSKCSRVIKLNQREDYYEFHFKGVCAGESLRKIRLRGRKDFNIRLDEEYLLYVGLITCSGGVLSGEILKVKALAECWDRS
jgi:hypothetical protein